MQTLQPCRPARRPRRPGGDSSPRPSHPPRIPLVAAPWPRPTGARSAISMGRPTISRANDWWSPHPTRPTRRSRRERRRPAMIIRSTGWPMETTGTRSTHETKRPSDFVARWQLRLHAASQTLPKLVSNNRQFCQNLDLVAELGGGHGSVDADG